MRIGISTGDVAEADTCDAQRKEALIMTTIPTRQDVADQLRALIAGTTTREEVSAWACKYALIDSLEIIDKVVSRALATLVMADAVPDMENYLYHEVDFRKWLEDLSS
jgi:hypothetical protein